MAMKREKEALGDQCTAANCFLQTVFNPDRILEGIIPWTLQANRKKDIDERGTEACFETAASRCCLKYDVLTFFLLESLMLHKPKINPYAYATGMMRLTEQKGKLLQALISVLPYFPVLHCRSYIVADMNPWY